MSELELQTSQRREPFGLWSATFLVVANMIGAGIFTTSGFSFGDLGDRQYVMVAWVIGSLIAVCGAVSYGHLAQKITESGGEYLFLTRMVHPSVGFIAGWVSMLAGFTGAIAFAAKAFESYAVPESIQPDWYLPGLVAIAPILIFGVLHSFVLKKGLAAQNLIVLVKLILLVLFVGFAFSTYPAGWQGMQVETEAVPFSIFAIASTLVWISLSFSGFNAAVYVTGEVDKPETNVPRALLLGTLLVSAFYFVLNFIFLFGAKPESIKNVKDVAAAASFAIGGQPLAGSIRGIVSVALLSSVSSMVVAGPRVYAKMAEDGVFPSWFNAVDRGQQTVPTAAIWLQVGLAVTVVCFSTLKSLLDYLGFTLSVSAALTVACIFWTKRGESTSRKGYQLIAGVYVVATITLAVLFAIKNTAQLIAFVVTVASGLILYGVSKNFRSVD